MVNTNSNQADKDDLQRVGKQYKLQQLLYSTEETDFEDDDPDDDVNCEHDDGMCTCGYE